MRDYLKFYINGAWVDPVTPKTLDVINPATEAVAGRIAMGSAADVDKAVKAARAAFETWSQSSLDERIALFERLLAEYKKRYADMAAAITEEMGAPAALAQKAQAGSGIGHLQAALAVLKQYSFEQPLGTTMVVKEPIGVCGLITPWNWPVNQIACKVAPALAVGCTMVLKPSEIAPFSAQVWTEIVHAAGVPAGVFNLVYGDGPTVGAAIASHPGVDMVSFTGSTRAGIEVARNAAPTVKRVSQELGGKSPNIILPDADFKRAVTAGVRYGEGELVMKSGATRKVYWAGPSIGFDLGANASKVFVLVYKLEDPDAIFKRFPGVDGSLYYVGGVGLNYQRADGVTLAPIRLGAGLRAGASVGYTHYRREKSLNPL